MALAHLERIGISIIMWHLLAAHRHDRSRRNIA